MIQQGGHARIQQLFAPEGNGGLSYFYASNKIISNPAVMVDILKDFTQLALYDQQKLLNEVISILEQVSTNSYILNSIQETSILQLLIDIIPHYVDNYLIFNKLLVVFDYIIRMSSTDQKLIQKAIKKLVIEYHSEQGQISDKSLFATLNILKSYFNCKINMDKQPEKMIVFHGSNGLQIISKKDINWLFSNGMSIYFWLNIQNIKFGPDASLPRLFTFYSPNNGGLQCYLIDNKIHYRTVGSKYNSPKIGSNGICLGQIQPKKWNFIGIEHEGPKKILGRSHLNFYLNDKKFSFSLSPPSISSKQKMKIVLFDKIYCKTSSLCILPYFIDNDIASSLNKNKNSIDLIKNPKAFIFQQRQGQLFQRNQLGFCPDKILHRTKYMSFQTFIPLFHIIKATNRNSNSYPILNELFSLFVLFLYKSPSNQIEAQKKNYPHMMSQIVKSMQNLSERFNQQTINTLLHIKQTITNSELLKQYHGQLLWGFIDSKISITCKQMLLQIIKNNFTQNVSYFSNIIGLDQMINAILKLSTKVNHCCQKHYKITVKRIDKQVFQQQNQPFGENQIALQYILKIIQLQVQNEKVNSAQQIYKLCRVLSIKFSPCFTLSFMNMIKRILSQKMNQKLNSNQAKKTIEYLMKKKIYLIFLHLIQNSFFAQIKAESVRILYSLLIKKASLNQQEEISHRLSKSLWKINQDDQFQKSKVVFSKQSSPKKKQIEPNPLPSQAKAIHTRKQSRKSSGSNILKIASITSQQQQQSMSQNSNNKNKASSIFKQVGPQAPPLTNRIKGNKSFSFNFMNEDKTNELAQVKATNSEKQLSFKDTIKIKNNGRKQLAFHFDQDQIMQQEKTNDNEVLESIKQGKQDQKQNTQALKEESQKPKKKIRSLGLNIDTQAINQMYNQKGQQIVITEEQNEAQIQRIRKLAKICLASMRGQKQIVQTQSAEVKKDFVSGRFIQPPTTITNKALKARQQLKIEQLKLIDQESQPQSAVKKINPNIKAINTSIPSPNLGSKKSKSPTSMNSINDQNLVILYNSLMQNCIAIPTYQISTPSIMYIFFAWIPQTNLQVKFLYDLSLIIQNDQKKEKIRTLVKMPQLYDFLFQLTYKALIFQEMGQKRLYTQKLQDLIKKIFSFIFRQQPQSIDKFSFIIDWSLNKAKQYHPKCLFLTSRYVFFLIMDAIQQDLFTNAQNDKLMQRNFQYLGMIVSKFCKFLPAQSNSETNIDVFIDSYDRVVFNQSFGMLASIAPYFTSQWVDYLICQKYYILFKKFFCTDWYRKNLKIFEGALSTNNKQLIENILMTSLNSQALVLNAQAQYYIKNSFIFTMIDVNRLLFIEKAKKNEKQQKAQIIWQTIIIILFAESIRQKNQKVNSEFLNTFLKNCKIFCQLQVKKASLIIDCINFIKSYLAQNNITVNMSSTEAHENTRDLRSSQGPKPTHFAQFIFESYINPSLINNQNEADFQSFKLNFSQVWITGQSYQSKMKSILYCKLMENINQVEQKTPQYIQKLSNLLEQQSQRFSNLQVIVQASCRQARNSFRKLWKNLRLYGGPWTHPELKLQNDTLFNRNLFTYERYENSKFYKLRVCKQMSKYRLRYLLKPILNDQNFIMAQNSQVNYQKQQIGLSNALLYYQENKLLIGAGLLQWIFHKQNSNIINNNSSLISGFRELDIIMNFKKVRLVKTLTVRHGLLGVINDKLIFLNSFYKQPPSHLSIAQYELKYDKKLYKMWPLQFVKQIFKRRYVNRKRAIQITFIYGKSVMLEFYENDQEDFLKRMIKLKGTKCPNLIYNKTFQAKKIYQAQGYLKKWNTYEISNFQYLMELNNLSGRSYCDLTQYPVVPWILVNFDTKLILSQQNNFRNLTLPMGALGSEQRTQGFNQRYQNMGEIQQQKFHYGTHYSSPAIVYHFLVRLSPFTQGSILLQSGKFDFADRLFFSINDSFKNATSQYSDVRQLIPEMYTIPEAYLNINKLDLGVMQNQKRVHNVQLPTWARQNPFLYITKLRRAFQELSVSKNINKWIDLIFGFKQRGQEAVKNLNCFVHLTYQDSVNFQQLNNSKTVKAIQTQILNFGQTPSQLFSKPHQQRTSPLSLQMSGTICDPNVEPKIYRPSRHAGSMDQNKDQKQEFNALKQPGQSIIHMKWFKDSRLVFIRRNGEMLFYKWHTAQPGSSKIPFQCAIQRQKIIPRINKNSIQNLEFYDGSLKSDSFPIQLFNNGHHIALGGQADGKLLVIDFDTNLVESYSQHSHTISCIRADSKDNFLITGDISGHVIVWRITNNHKLSFYNEMRDHHLQITSIFISYDLRCLFTSSKDGSVFGYNIITGRKVKVFYHPKMLAISNVIVSTSPLPVVLLFCNQQSIIYCYSINGQLIQRMHQKQIDHFLSPVLIRDTFGFEHIAYGNEHGQTIFRTLPFLDNQKKHIVAKDAAVNRVCLSKSNKFVIVGCSDGQLSVITVPQNQTAK